MSNLIIPGLARTHSGIVLPAHLHNQVSLITTDFRNTYFQLVGGAVTSWYDRYDGYLNFVGLSQSEIQRINGMRDFELRSIAGEVQGVGDVLAMRLQDYYGVNGQYLSADIGSAVDDILSQRMSRMLEGTRRLGYWSGFARAINY